MNLYQINSAIEDFIAENTDPDTGELLNLDKLMELSMERERKIDNLAMYIKNLKALSEAIKAEKLSLEARQKQVNFKIDRLSDFLQNFLAGDKYQSASCAISYRKSTSVEIEDISKIPNEYLKYSEPTVNKAELKKALAIGDVDGAKLNTNVSMTIK